VRKHLIVLWVAAWTILYIASAFLPASAQLAPPSTGWVGLGYQQVTSIGSAKSLTVPAGTTMVVFTAEAQAVRWRDDGTAPTSSVGMLVAVGATVQYSGPVSKLQFIEVTSGGIVDVSYYR
jgi:hypothetical protein